MLMRSDLLNSRCIQQNPPKLMVCTQCFFRNFGILLGLINGGAVAQIRSVNHTIVILIPKKNNPTSVTDFRPISLCQMLYKVVAKTLANRLKPLLCGLISEEQSTFVEKLLITDNAIIAFETFHCMRKRHSGKQGFMALKLDMMKAYDRIEWELGFSIEFVRRVMSCVSSVRFSFKFNGKIHGNLIPSRGIRQGCPLSPYLFIICMEVLSSLISRAVDNCVLHGVSICRRAPAISHLLFADDSMLLAHATLMEVEQISDILERYKRASGQKVHWSKTEVTFSRNVQLLVRGRFVLG
ncbi:hypothetical protein V2J09_020249 [Rumex salicifolius]